MPLVVSTGHLTASASDGLLARSTADEVDRTLNIEQSLQGTQVQEGEYYELVPFNSIISTVSVVRSNIAISPFTEKLPWPLHRFYINRFLPSRDPLLSTEKDFTDSVKPSEEQDSASRLTYE